MISRSGIVFKILCYLGESCNYVNLGQSVLLVARLVGTCYSVYEKV